MKSEKKQQKKRDIKNYKCKKKKTETNQSYLKHTEQTSRYFIIIIPVPLPRQNKNELISLYTIAEWRRKLKETLGIFVNNEPR